MGRLVVCCPHIVSASGALIVEGGPLTISPDITIMRGAIAQLVTAQEKALARLHVWTARESGELLLQAHANCTCAFLAPLDREGTEERLQALACDLHENLFRRPRVTTRVIDLPRSS